MKSVLSCLLLLFLVLSVSICQAEEGMMEMDPELSDAVLRAVDQCMAEGGTLELCLAEACAADEANCEMEDKTSS